MLELLQNADDCEFPPGAKPSLKVTFESVAQLSMMVKDRVAWDTGTWYRPRHGPWFGGMSAPSLVT